jgi:hypothetical protein
MAVFPYAAIVALNPCFVKVIIAQFWVMALGDGTRAFAHVWEKLNPPVNGIGSLILEAKAQNVETTYMLLEYNSANKSECASAERATKAKTL